METQSEIDLAAVTRPTEKPPLPVLISYSEKGGVGKTSTATGLVAAAAERGLRVLAVDLDPRYTATKELGVRAPARTINDLLYIDQLSGDVPGDPAELVHEAIVPAGSDWPSTVRVLPAERALARRETDSTPFEHRLRQAIEGLAGHVDVVVIDTPPRAGGKLTASALLAGTDVFVPATLTTDGYDGAVEALQTLKFYAAPSMNKFLRLVGIIRSITPAENDMRKSHGLWERNLLETFGDLVLATVVRDYIVREEARGACVPITAAPGREARLLLDSYGQLLDHALKRESR